MVNSNTNRLKNGSPFVSSEDGETTQGDIPVSTIACVHGSTIGTNGIPISVKVLPMVPLVLPLVPMVMPMVPLALPMVQLVPLVSQWYHWLPMVPLVKLPMVPLGEP